MNNENKIVKILYTNYKGETGWRNIIPTRVRFASSEWHPGEQWLLDALDVDKNAERSFAMKDIKEWKVN
jgi:predicted DNA-binding transcriptional regulator YafY